MVFSCCLALSAACSTKKAAIAPPRAPGETPFAYEGRLRLYASGAPARFAIETAGGRLQELGLAVGDRVPLDRESLIGRVR